MGVGQNLNQNRSAAAEPTATWHVITGAFASPINNCPSLVGPLVAGAAAATGSAAGGTPSAIATLEVAPTSRALIPPPSAMPSISSSSYTEAKEKRSEYSIPTCQSNNSWRASNHRSNNGPFLKIAIVILHSTHHTARKLARPYVCKVAAIYLLAA